MIALDFECTFASTNPGSDVMSKISEWPSDTLHPCDCTNASTCDRLLQAPNRFEPATSCIGGKANTTKVLPLIVIEDQSTGGRLVMQKEGWNLVEQSSWPSVGVVSSCRAKIPYPSSSRWNCRPAVAAKLFEDVWKQRAFGQCHWKSRRVRRTITSSVHLNLRQNAWEVPQTSYDRHPGVKVHHIHSVPSLDVELFPITDASEAWRHPAACENLSPFRRPGSARGC